MVLENLSLLSAFHEVYNSSLSVFQKSHNKK
jgi:hypothetical protein